MTTRVEDRAYSLIGLFCINMPIIYEEHKNAPLQLQQHIIQTSNDEPLFAWIMGFAGHKRTYVGLFAPSPSAYVDCSGII